MESNFFLLFSGVSNVLQMPSYQHCMKYMSFPSQEAFEEIRSQKRPHNLRFFISKLRILFFPLSFLVLFSFCTRWLLVFFRDERQLFGSLQRVTELWKSLVFQSCSFSILYPIWRWWSKGSELREKLKDVCFGVNNNKTNPQTHKRPSFKDCPSANAREHTAVFPYLKMHLVLMNLNGSFFWCFIYPMTRMFKKSIKWILH